MAPSWKFMELRINSMFHLSWRSFRQRCESRREENPEIPALFPEIFL